MKVSVAAIVLASAAPALSLSYLDQLNRPAASAPTGRGAGMGGYLDNLPQAPPRAAGGGGMSSYANSLGGPAAPAQSAPAPAAPAPAQSYSFDSEPASGSAAPNSASYLSHLNSGASAAPSGPGMTGYLDALPRGAALVGGAGLQTHTSTLSVNAAPGGPGIQSFTEMLSGGKKPFGKSFAPSGKGMKKGPPPPANYGTNMGFTLEAENMAQAIGQMSGAGTIRISGSIDNISYN